MKIKDRIVILNILPQQGNFTTLTVKHDLVEKIKITQEEIKDLEMGEESGMIKWNVDKDIDKEFDLTDLEKKLIKDTLKELDEKKQLNDDTFNLLKLF